MGRVTKRTAEKSKLKARKLLARIMPFDEWCARTNPTEGERRLYLLIRQDLDNEAELGSATEVPAISGDNGQCRERK